MFKTSLDNICKFETMGICKRDSKIGPKEMLSSTNHWFAEMHLAKMCSGDLVNKRLGELWYHQKHLFVSFHR